jgi:hypothetical protein
MSAMSSQAPSGSLRIVLTPEEGALVMEALAEYPFKSVFELIGKLNLQANIYSSSALPASAAHDFDFTAPELSLAIKALGDLPFNRVNVLLANVNGQISAQLEPRHRKKAATDHVDA